jgi:hypothetical protein
LTWIIKIERISAYGKTRLDLEINFQAGRKDNGCLLTLLEMLITLRDLKINIKSKHMTFNFQTRHNNKELYILARKMVSWIYFFNLASCMAGIKSGLSLEFSS